MATVSSHQANTAAARPASVPLMDMVGGLGLPRPRQQQMVAVSTVKDMNPFPGPRPLPLDPQCGHGVGRGAALANLLATFHTDGPATHPQPPLENPLDIKVTAVLPPPLLPSAPTVSSVPRPWLPRTAPLWYALLAQPTVICLPSPPAETSCSGSAWWPPMSKYLTQPAGVSW